MQSAMERILVYRDVCVLQVPSLARDYEQAVSAFRTRFKEAAVPLQEKYKALPQYNVPSPPSWTRQLSREQDELRAKMADVDEPTCRKFLSNLREVDMNELMAQLSSSLDRLAQVPLDQIKGLP
jgi:hypothetical protein